jgi:hypothetical protein
MMEFKVMVRPIKALATPGDETGNRIGPQLSLLKQAAGVPRCIPLLMASPLARACAGGGLVARIGAPCWSLFGRFSYRGMLP